MKQFILTIIAILSASIPSLLHGEEIKGISDNSFLVEEAYNQEPGVIQHINTWNYNYAAKEWLYTFTQEWPLPDRLNQFSYTISVSRLHLNSKANTGLGDVLLNYRIQAYNGTVISFSPRLSLIVPTGSYKKGLGSGYTGFQINLPASIYLGRYFVTHLNAGVTITPHAKFKSLYRGTVRYNFFNYSFAGSIIWLAHNNFNLVLEGACSYSETPAKFFGTTRNYNYYINPGFRFAIDHKSGLQIVPGLSFPVGLGSTRGNWGVYVYLSFEHAAWESSENVKI